MRKAESLRVYVAAFVLWMHDSREAIKCVVQIVACTAIAAACCWLYCALCFVVVGS